MSRHTLRLVVLGAALVTAAARADERPGHSVHGAAFDTGLRQRPWRMEGIGRVHFPVTTKHPEVQGWFDQGMALLHSFWFEEAERSFRWCLKLDPDCGMAYWGLAATGLNWFTEPALDKPQAKRGLEFLREATRRKAAVTPRERMYIEAWEQAFIGESKERSRVLAGELQKLAVLHPDDVEAVVLHALYSIDAQHSLGTELVLREVFRKEPDHPGGHHYRIHAWDFDAALVPQALESCHRYPLVAPAIGHANHMPGHSYAKLGMWHEAARAMDAATRVELVYMNERLALPFETWNYAHNRNYLCFIHGQLGMERAAIAGARDLLAAPRDPLRNTDGQGAFEQGVVALVRGLVAFERWDEILAADSIPWRDTPTHAAARAAAETFALIGKERLVDARARLADLRGLVTPEAGEPWQVDFGLLADAAEGLLLAAEGDLLEASRLLLAAAAAEKKKRADGSYRVDPPPYPWPVDRRLGDVYLAQGEYRLATEAYERALEAERNDGFALAGLVQARAAVGDQSGAARAAGRLAAVWSGADPDLRWRHEAAAVVPDAPPAAETVAAERPYRIDLEAGRGPLDWEPFSAPALACLDANGRSVKLEDFRGRNVLLVFYLGADCVHCVEQLRVIDGRRADWTASDTVVLAVSGSLPESLKPADLQTGEALERKPKDQQPADLPGGLAVRLLADPGHETARRFTAYDDFEEMELHATILIDRVGRVHWKRTGGDPFLDMEFLLAELRRMNRTGKPAEEPARERRTGGADGPR